MPKQKVWKKTLGGFIGLGEMKDFYISKHAKLTPREVRDLNERGIDPSKQPKYSLWEITPSGRQRKVVSGTLALVRQVARNTVEYENRKAQGLPPLDKPIIPRSSLFRKNIMKRRNPIYPFISDASHGWLKVPLTELRELGIADKISRFSHKDGHFAYLEQDRDARIFLKAMQNAGLDVNVSHFDDGNVSEIRSMASYTKPPKSRKKNPKSGVYKKRGSHGKMMYFQDGKFISKKTYDSLKNPRKNSAKGDYILKLSPAQVEVLFDYHGGQTSMFYSVASQATMRRSGGQAKIRRQDMESFQIELNRAIVRAGKLDGSTGDLRSLQAIDNKVEKLLAKQNPRRRKNAGHSYVIMFRSVDGAGYIKADNWKGHPQDMDRPKKTFSNKQSAIKYANELQKKSDKNGNPFGYTYSVHTDNYPSRKVYQTKISNPPKRKNSNHFPQFDPTEKRLPCKFTKQELEIFDELGGRYMDSIYDEFGTSPRNKTHTYEDIELFLDIIKQRGREVERMWAEYVVGGLPFGLEPPSSTYLINLMELETKLEKCMKKF